MLEYFAGCSENNEQKISFGGQFCTEKNVRCINVSMQSIVKGYNELHVFQKFLQMKIHKTISCDVKLLFDDVYRK